MQVATLLTGRTVHSYGQDWELLPLLKIIIGYWGLAPPSQGYRPSPVPSGVTWLLIPSSNVYLPGIPSWQYKIFVLLSVPNSSSTPLPWDITLAVWSSTNLSFYLYNSLVPWFTELSFIPAGWGLIFVVVLKEFLLLLFDFLGFLFVCFLVLWDRVSLYGPETQQRSSWLPSECWD